MVRASAFRARCGRATEEEKAHAILAVGSFDSLGTGMDGGDETIVSYLSSVEGHFFNYALLGRKNFLGEMCFYRHFSAITHEIDVTMQVFSHHGKCFP